MSKLFDDASLAMIPSAYKDGKLYSIRPVPEYGTELVTNGGFDTDSDWSINGSNIAISGGKANFTNAVTNTDFLQQAITAPTGVQYRIQFEVSNLAAGDSIKVRFPFQDTTINSNGLHTLYSEGTHANFLRITPNSSTGTFSIDNVSVKEVSNIGDFTFSRGSNLAATRVDVNGLIEKGRENLALYSNTFTSWNTISGSVTSGQAGYDGSNDAWLLTKTGDWSRVEQTISQTGVWTFSVYAKAGTSNWLALENGGVSSDTCYFNLANGTKGSVGSGTISSSIESVGNGWYRCSVTINDTSGIQRIYVATSNGNINGSNGTIYIQDSQLESGLVSTSVIETGATTAQAGILEDMPRLDYSGGASCPSLLLEPQRSNLVTHSEYQGSGSGYNILSSSLTWNAGETTSPEGLQGAGAFLETAITTSHSLYRDVSVTSGSTYAISFYVKSIGGRNLKLSGGGTAFTFQGDIDLSDGTEIGNSWSGIDRVESVGNGWYRVISESLTAASTTGRVIFYGLDGNNFNYAGDTSKGYAIWGYQLEQGSYPTSYIPTYGTSQTRSVDSMANLDIPDFNNNTSFSVLLELTRNGISSSEIGSMFSFYNDSSTQQFWFHIDAPNSQVRLRDTTNSNATMATISFDTDDRKKIAFSCDGSTLKTYADGVLSNTYNLVNVFNVDELRTNAKSFDVHQILTFPTALTDSECIALTTL